MYQSRRSDLNMVCRHISKLVYCSISSFDYSQLQQLLENLKRKLVSIMTKEELLTNLVPGLIVIPPADILFLQNFCVFYFVVKRGIEH